LNINQNKKKKKKKKKEINKETQKHKLEELVNRMNIIDKKAEKAITKEDLQKIERERKKIVKQTVSIMLENING